MLTSNMAALSRGCKPEITHRVASFEWILDVNPTVTQRDYSTTCFLFPSVYYNTKMILK